MMNTERIRKEIRTLSPTWLAVAGLVIGLQILGRHHGVASAGAALAFIIGSATLGALSFGSEYDSRTMHYLLSQPSPRGLLWVEKMFVSCLAFVALYLITLVSIPLISYGPFDSANFLNTSNLFEVGIVPLCAFGATPFLTLVSRSTFTGALLSIVLPILLLLDANWMITKLHIQLKDDTLFWLNMGLLAGYSLIFGSLGYLKFSRLQLVESGNRLTRWSFQLPWKLGTKSKSKIFTSPISRLAIKEFRLQAITYFIAAACVMIWLVYWRFKHAPVLNEGAVLGLYTPIITLIAGGISIASERTLGTTALQLALPISPFKLWLTKFSIVTLTSLLLGVILPVIVLIYDGSDFRQWDSLDAGFTGCSWFALVCLGMFASSISKTPVRGSIVAVLLLVFCLILFVYFGGIVVIASNNHPPPPSVNYPSGSLADAKKMSELIPEINRWLIFTVPLSFGAITALFGFLNFRNVLPQMKRLYWQIGILCCFVIAVGFVSKRLNEELESCIKIVNQSQIP